MSRSVRWSMVVWGLAWCVDSAPADDAKRVELPLKRVVLMNSGVGFFEHGASVDGSAEVELRFRVDQINDLLKSLLVEDAGGGRITSVAYDAQEPLARTLKTFSIDLSEDRPLAALLQQIRGEEVELTGSEVMRGRILGVETRKERVGEETLEAAILNLATVDGLAAVPLTEVKRVRLLNAKLDAELQAALRLLAGGLQADRKSVLLNFQGQGERKVRVAYLQEAPIWKTSYRLVLRDGQTPRLQGWAIVENSSEQDWTDVGLTLVSGRPISFVMDLYQPLYVRRPQVEPELFASLRSQAYEQSLQDAQNGLLASQTIQQLNRAPGAGEAHKPGAAMGGFGGGGAGPAGGAGKRSLFGGLFTPEQSVQPVQPIDPTQGFAAAATAGDVGELFQYAIDAPVTLPRQRSAMLPIVDGACELARVSIYNPAVQAKHPLHGVRLKNTTGVHLMQGPITVVDDGNYAGDAQIEDLAAGDSRLISYALDLETEVAFTPRESQKWTALKIVKGVLTAVDKIVDERTYLAKNSSDADRTLLIEQPLQPEFKLVEPAQAAEQTASLYRFELPLAAGKTAELKVRTERTMHSETALTEVDDDALLVLLQSGELNPKLREALVKLQERRAALAEAQSKIATAEKSIDVIGQEQNRIRQNMPQLDKTSELYQRYVKMFSEQEDQIAATRSRIAELSAESDQRRREVDEYVAQLVVE